jgi:transposase-like protein
MDFPITELLDDEACMAWFLKHFHPDGLKCPKCRAGVDQARFFRQTQRSQISVYRCRQCQRVYNLYTGTVFEGTRLRPPQVGLLLRGVCKGEPSLSLAREVGVSRTTAHLRRQALQANAERLQPATALTDSQTETDEMFQNAGEKGEKHADPADPPRRRANKRRGHGTYENDRPPVVGTVGRASGQVRLRVAHRTDGKTLHQQVHQFTEAEATAYTDEWQGYHAVARAHATVAHGQKEWARDDDGDGIREVHVNTIEGLWTTVRNFLRLFRGVHKRYLSQYIAICEFRINLKRISAAFISALVALHLYCT